MIIKMAYERVAALKGFSITDDKSSSFEAVLDDGIDCVIKSGICKCAENKDKKS